MLNRNLLNWPSQSVFWKNVPTEYASCGVGFVDTTRSSRDAISMALRGLCGMSDRSGVAFGQGDGAGVSIETETGRNFFEGFVDPSINASGLPQLSVGNISFPFDIGHAFGRKVRTVTEILNRYGLSVNGWRQVPTDINHLPQFVQAKHPNFWQVMISGKEHDNKQSLRLKLFNARRSIEERLPELHVVSLNPNTTVYKSIVTPEQFRGLFPDLTQGELESQRVTYHGRMSTNTSPSIGNAQPFGLIAHNGEINTILALCNALEDWEVRLGLTNEGAECTTVAPWKSDTRRLDGIIADMMIAGGVRLPEAMRWVMLPASDDIYSADIKKWHNLIRRIRGPLSAVQGPAAIVGMTGHRIMIAKDPQDLRTFWIVEAMDGTVIGSSEMGAPALPLDQIKTIRQLRGGEIAFVSNGQLILPAAVENDLHDKSDLRLDGDDRIIQVPAGYGSLESNEGVDKLSEKQIIKLFNQVGGDQYVTEIIKSLAIEGKEPADGMGDGRPLAIFCSGLPRIADYFSQLVAQITNPTIDPIREGESFDQTTYLGRSPKQIDARKPHQYKASPEFLVDSPILTSEQFQKIRTGTIDDNTQIQVAEIDASLEGNSGADIQCRLDAIIEEAIELAEEDDHPIMVFTDRACVGSDRLFVPAVFVAASVDQALRKRGLRSNVKLLFDTADAFYGHDNALILAHGADAVHPYLTWNLVAEASPIRGIDAGGDLQDRLSRTHQALVSELKEIMSKLGISDINGYIGSRAFEAFGIGPELMPYLEGTISRLGGIGFDELAEDQIKRREEAPDKLRKVSRTEEGDLRRGEIQKLMNELMNPANKVVNLEDRIKKLFSERSSEEVYVEIASLVANRDPILLRDLFKFKFSDEPLEAVEDIGDIICKTFRGSAMSDGALGFVAHSAIAAAFNDLAAEYGPRDGMICKSNSGEGGEDARRYPGGDLEMANSKAKQIASGRFGVNAHYILSVGEDGEINIKIGQGAKPGQGGHVKAHKVNERLALQRGVSPGTELISPSVQLDLFSIEDLMRLIGDIRALFPELQTASVKVTCKPGIGTIAVGAAKCGADKVILSGRVGGTATAKHSAKRNAGSPLELGIIEAFRSLQMQGMVDKIRLEVDSGIISGTDIIKLAILGADEFGFGTSLLMAGEGCIFCNKCSGGDCPTGITTQDPEAMARLGFGAKAAKILRTGDPLKYQEQYEVSKESIKTYLKLVAGEVQELLKKLGAASLQELKGRVDLLDRIERGDRTDKVDMSFVHEPVPEDQIPDFGDHEIRESKRVNLVNQKIVDAAAQGHSSIEVDLMEILEEEECGMRTIGATLVGKVVREEISLLEGGFTIKLKGYPGQSLGFCLIDGITIEVDGITRDFVANGMSGGKVVVRIPEQLRSADGYVIDAMGASCAYGATGGKLFVGGKAGQRFGVRASKDALLVAEGVGAYGFQYMTGGTGVVLSEDIGKQLGSAMSNGVVYVYNPEGTAQSKLHRDSVKAEQLDDDDLQSLKSIIEEFAADTLSLKAQMILNDWDNLKANFIKVIPKNPPQAPVTSDRGKELEAKMEEGGFVARAK